MIDFVTASLTWLPSYDKAYFLADNIILCSCGSHIEKWVSYDSTARWQRLLCSGQETPTVRSALWHRTSPMISIWQPVNNFLNSRHEFSSKLYSVKQSKVSTLLSVLSRVSFPITSITSSRKDILKFVLWMCKVYNVHELVSCCIICRNCRRKLCGLASEYSVKTVVSNDEAVFSVLVLLGECRTYLWNLQLDTGTLGKWPTWCTIMLYNTYIIIIILCMFRSTLCSSLGGQIVLIQHPV